MGTSVKLEPSSKRGLFEIQVDGKTVVSRKGGLLAKLLKKPWPQMEAVVAAVLQAGAQ